MKKDITNIPDEVAKFGNVKEVMSYFTVDELQYQQQQQQHKELIKIRKHLREDGIDTNILKDYDLKTISEVELEVLNKRIPRIKEKLNKIKLTEEDISEIIDRLKKHTYFPPAVKPHTIDKEDGKTRTLGIPVHSDKVVQRTATGILNLIYEPLFSNSSHRISTRQRMSYSNKAYK